MNEAVKECVLNRDQEMSDLISVKSARERGSCRQSQSDDDKKDVWGENKGRLDPGEKGKGKQLNSKFAKGLGDNLMRAFSKKRGPFCQSLIPPH